jgi:O-antigen/teichoic acid export membrane protein/glycosyltransferase involved in cell wall biosynthesis
MMKGSRVVKTLRSTATPIMNQVPALSKVTKDLGIYALSSITVPLISLALAPFLTHALSPSDYGTLILLNTLIALMTGLTQLGMGSAFFRAYNYDYTERNERDSVVVTTTFLLFLVSMLTVISAIVIAHFLAHHLFGHTSLSRLIVIAGGVIFVQNLAIPGFAWLRAENRALFYSLLAISNILTSLLANIVLVGMLHWGIEGALIATGIGYIWVVACTLSVIILRSGNKIRLDIARNLLGFGLPLVPSVVSYWILQLSDRYLLSILGSLTETAKYTIAYTLGTAINIVVISPFTLAWPTTMFSIARNKNAPHTFQIAFRWFSLVLLLSGFALSLCGGLILNWFFPVAYHSATYVIPIVSTSLVFYGLYNIFMIGANIQRKTWLSSIFITLAASVNLLMNLALIPRYGAMGAAVSTLVAYILLALIAYVVNQKLYPIAFEIERFVLAFLAGVALYAGTCFLVQKQGMNVTLGLYAGAVALYACILTALGIWIGARPRSPRMDEALKIPHKNTYLPIQDSESAMQKHVPKKVCMHVRGTVRTDERVMREAIALKDAQFAVTILDIEEEVTCVTEEEIRGIQVKHIIKPGWLKPVVFRPLRLLLSMKKLAYTTVKLIQTPADIYHAHDDNALAACYIAAIWHRTPLILDAHEFPLNNITHKRWLHMVVTHLFILMVRRCSEIITVSPAIAQEICSLYHVSNVSLVRNIACYQHPRQSNRLRHFLKLTSDVQIALYQGNLQDNRNLDTLVRAGAFVAENIVIVLMGKGIGATQARLEALIISEGVGNQVKIIPPVPYAELLEWTSSADIGLITFAPNYSTSIRLCLPNKLFEYLIAGLPVLATPLDAVAEILQHYDVGQIVSSLSPADIGATIEGMLTESISLERMHHNALAAAQKELCWEQERFQLIQLYRNIMPR